jgi:pimeloyl-ACP methyl ester carboxylesterase
MAAAAMVGACTQQTQPRLPAGQIAYSEQGGLWVMQADGTGRREVFNDSSNLAVAPSWAPNGQRLVFQLVVRNQSGGDSLSELAVVGVDGTGFQKLPGTVGAEAPSWSPDGSRIAFSLRGRLMTIAPDGSGLTDLSTPGGCPVWSPDSKWIAYCGVGSGGTLTSDLYIVRADGMQTTRLTTMSATRVWPGAWSPDGAQIAFTSNVSGDADLYVIRSNGSGARRLFKEPGTQSVTAWLADGRILYADSRESEPRSTWRAASLDGSGAIALPSKLYDPIAWLPDAADRVRLARLKGGPHITTSAQADEVRQRIAIGGGRKVFMDCQGRGSPTVVLDAGLGVDSQTWLAVQAAVAPHTRVCRYDRAGLGLSDPGPPPRDSAAMVRELRALLQAARIEPPYVLVGASLGGLNVQLYQSLYPAEVAGMVLVDSLHPDLDREIETLLTPAQVSDRRQSLEQTGEGVRFQDLLASDAELRAAWKQIAIPVVVIRHGLPFEAASGFPSAAVEELWARLQHDLAARSSKGREIVALKSHHRIAESEADVVAQAIESLL